MCRDQNAVVLPPWSHWCIWRAEIKRLLPKCFRRGIQLYPLLQGKLQLRCLSWQTDHSISMWDFLNLYLQHVVLTSARDMVHCFNSFECELCGSYTETLHHGFVWGFNCAKIIHKWGFILSKIPVYLFSKTVFCNWCAATQWYTVRN